MRIIMSAAVALVLTLNLMGCNTVEGVGKDIKRAGQGIESAADRSK